MIRTGTKVRAVTGPHAGVRGTVVLVGEGRRLVAVDTGTAPSAVLVLRMSDVLVVTRQTVG